MTHAFVRPTGARRGWPLTGRGRPLGAAPSRWFAGGGQRHVAHPPPMGEAQTIERSGALARRSALGARLSAAAILSEAQRPPAEPGPAVPPRSVAAPPHPHFPPARPVQAGTGDGFTSSRPAAKPMLGTRPKGRPPSW